MWLQNRVRRAIAAAGIAMALTCQALAAPAATAKPNVVFVLADDLGYGDVGWTWQTRRAAGEARILTPNLDRLAGEGTVLSAHYCAAPVCAPSRASILTGRLQRKAGGCSVRDNMFDHPITEPETLGTVMKRGGYRTMAIGKWGVGGGGESGTPVTAHPLDKGFDTFYGFMDHMAGHTYYHYDGFIRGAYMGVWENREKATESAVGRYSTDLFVARAKKEIEDSVREHPGEPFFLYLAVNTVHGSGRSDDTLKEKHPLHVPGRPYPERGVEWPLAPEPLDARNTWIDPRYRDLADENMRRYATAISRLDDAIGDLMRHLEKLGVAKNTVVVFTSDNGPADEYGADTRFFGSSGPFDGLKRDVYEGGMRVPTFVWGVKSALGVNRGQSPDSASDFRGQSPNGCRGQSPDSASDSRGQSPKEDAIPSISTDWMVTFAQIAGVGKPAQCDGVSLLPRWGVGGACPEPSRIETAYHGYPGGQRDFAEFAERKGGLVRGDQEMRREGDFVTLRAGGPGKPWRRYDVVADPHQDCDLAAHPPSGDAPSAEVLSD